MEVEESPIRRVAVGVGAITVCAAVTDLNCKGASRFIEKCKVEDRVTHRKLVISGRTAQFKAELEQAMPKWEIIVGPAEAALVTGFLPGFAEELKDPPET